MENQKEIKIAFFIIVVIIVVGSIIGKLALIKADKLRAEYEESFHTVYFDTDGGEYIPPKEIQSYFYPSDARAKKDGYIFQGWLLDGQLIRERIPITHDVTLKASYRDLRPTNEQIVNAKTIDYITLFKGSQSTNVNKFFNITGEVYFDVGNNSYIVNMTKKGTYISYYTDSIKIEVKGKTSEVLMKGDIISFVGECLGYDEDFDKIPFLRVYAENLKVIGHTN